MNGCRNIRFIASAGTGKTHQVVNLYQALLFGRPYPPDTAALPGAAPGSIYDGNVRVPPERMLMLTFTRNAAAEMRARVTEAIERELAAGDPANEAFCWSLLRRLSGATIATIHSFAQQLLASHALHLGLSPTLTVLEEADADTLRDDVIRDALKAALAGTDAPLSSHLEQLCDGRGLDGVQQGIAQILRKGAAWGLDLELEPAALVALPEPPALRHLQTLLAAIEAAAGAHGGNMVKTLARDLAAIIKRLGASPAPEAIAAAAAALRPLTTRTWGAGDGVKALRVRTQEAIDTWRSYPDRREGARLLTALLTLARACARGARDRKRGQGVLDFDDLLFKARELILAGPGCIPPIDVIIVDEAQDNSRLQNEIIRLVQAQTRAAVIMCGDTKQTIYGWRGADPDGLPQCARELQLEPVPLRTSFRSQRGVLDWVNDIFAGVVMGPELYGTDETLVPCPAAQPLTGPSVELLLPEWECRPRPDERVACGKKGDRPRVMLTRTDLKTPADQDEDAERAAALQRSEQAAALEARAVARRIRLLTTPGSPKAWHPLSVWDAASQSWVAAPSAPYRFRDILVLLRATTRQDLYEQALQEERIPFTTDGKGRGFFARQETLDISNLLTWLAFPLDRLAWIGLLRSPFVALSDTAIALLEQDEASDFGAILRRHGLADDADTFARGMPALARLRALAGRISAVDLIRQAIRMTGYDAIIAGTFHGIQRLANLQKLLSWIQHRERAENLDPQAVAKRLADEISGGRQSPDAAVLDPSDDAVRINTIHAAKGLSSPVVIVPDLRRAAMADRDWVLLSRDAAGTAGGITGKLKLFGEDTGDEREIACEGFAGAAERNKAERDRESRRLFYVACTRARDLVILSGENPARGGDETWRAWINRHLVQCDFNPEIAHIRSYGEVEEAWQSLCAGAAKPVPLITPAQLAGVSLAPCPKVTRARFRFPVTALTQALPAAALAPVSVERATTADTDAARMPPSDGMETMASTPTEFGTLAHRILEALDYAAATPLDRQVREALAGPSLPEAGRTAWMNRIAGAAHMLATMLEEVPQPDIIREMPFAARFEHNGACVVVDGKVDLVFRKAGVWHIVDYKFSDHSAAELTARYGFQLAVYLEALSDPIPGTTRRTPRFTAAEPAEFRLFLLGVNGQGHAIVIPVPNVDHAEVLLRLVTAARSLHGIPDREFHVVAETTQEAPGPLAALGWATRYHGRTPPHTDDAMREIRDGEDAS